MTPDPPPESAPVDTLHAVDRLQVNAAMAEINRASSAAMRAAFVHSPSAAFTASVQTKEHLIRALAALGRAFSTDPRAYASAMASDLAAELGPNPTAPAQAHDGGDDAPRP